MAMGDAERYNVVIIGAGIGGLSTAIWARRLGLSALVLDDGPEAGGQLRSIVQPIVDYPGLHGETGTTLAERLRTQAEAAGALLRPAARVLRIDAAARRCETATGAVTGDAVVLATGLAERRLGVPGEADLVPRGLRRRPTKEPCWFRGKRVAVVGGGDRAAENALLLTALAQRVHLLHRGDRLRARQSFQEAIAAGPLVDLRLETEVVAIHCHGDVIRLDLVCRSLPETLAVDALCIYIGNRPNTELVEGQVALLPEGYVIIDRDGQSSLPGIYAVGDVCTPPRYQSLATAAGQAMVAAKHIALTLSGQ
ncbi:MAG TPA: NAD(P)/FAD-dependent oxidoreductase [Symbiobacteriaceae bacterium]|nr:NAD(P)/FAD-dependent oxidoreductase [Symbiobacteriaceae bacterium]